jgi:hypothetical protein
MLLFSSEWHFRDMTIDRGGRGGGVGRVEVPGLRPKLPAERLGLSSVQMNGASTVVMELWLMFAC